MKHLGIAIVALGLLLSLGCTAKHSEGLGKHVTHLELYPSGTYRLWNTGVKRYDETGRWWPIEDEVAVLVPDDPSLYERFVNTTETFPFDDLEVYHTLREALANQGLPKPTRRDLLPIETSEPPMIDTGYDQFPVEVADELANHSVPGIYKR